MDDLGELLTGFPPNTLSVHLGEVTPVGIPSLSNLIDAAFPGYTPAFFDPSVTYQQANGFDLLLGSVQFSCQRANGFFAACLWIASSVAGGPFLVAYQPLASGEVFLPSSGLITLSLSVAVFQAPAGFYS